MTAADGHLVGFSPVSGTFQLYLQPDGSLHEEDSYARYLPIRDEAGAFAGIADAEALVRGALAAAAEGEKGRADELLALVKGETGAQVTVGQAVVHLVSGRAEAAERQIRRLMERIPSREVEGRINGAGYGLLQAEKLELARAAFALNTRIFPEAFNTWDSLGEVNMLLGNTEEAILHYRKSLALNPENTNAQAMIDRMQGEGGEQP